MQGSDWNAPYNEGWFGNTTGFKYVFPTTALTNAAGGNVWYLSIPAPEGGPYWELDNDAAYDIPSIQDSATRVAALIEYEKGLVGGDASKVFLAGFSQGG